jgi:hypothetical protein
VISTKSTEAYGLALNLASPDGINLARGNAPIATLIKDEMVIIKCGLTGFDASKIRVAEVKKRTKKSDGVCPTTSSA